MTNALLKAPVGVCAHLLCPESSSRRPPLVIHVLRDIGNKKAAADLTNRVLQNARELISIADDPNDAYEIDEMPPIGPLTEQEEKILSLLSAGKSSRAVADQLHISMRTLRNHLSNVTQKLHLRNRLRRCCRPRKGDSSENPRSILTAHATSLRIKECPDRDPCC